jgi:hypothetical protein
MGSESRATQSKSELTFIAFPSVSAGNGDSIGSVLRVVWDDQPLNRRRVEPQERLLSPRHEILTKLPDSGSATSVYGGRKKTCYRVMFSPERSATV